MNSGKKQKIKNQNKKLKGSMVNRRKYKDLNADYSQLRYILQYADDVIQNTYKIKSEIRCQMPLEDGETSCLIEF